MALLDSEIARLKWHLGFNLLDAGAEPYIGVAAIFSQVIQPYMTAGASTTSATAVIAATSPTPVTLTLASATGFSSGCRVIIDVDARQERVTVQSLSGASMVVHLSNAHSGTYPVTVEGGESIIRDLLTRCDEAATAYGDAISSAGIKQLGQGEIEWFGESGGLLGATKRALMGWRGELASALGLPAPGGNGCSVTLY